MKFDRRTWQWCRIASRTLQSDSHLEAIETKDVDLARGRTERDVQAYGRFLESALKEAGGSLSGTTV